MSLVYEFWNPTIAERLFDPMTQLSKVSLSKVGQFVNPPSASPWPRSILVAGLLGALTFAAIILYNFNPASAGFYPPSPFRLLTGLFCPGCGSLRALHHLLHGRVGQALDLNPLMVLMLPYLLYSLVSYISPVVFRRRIAQVFVPSRWIWTFLGVVGLYWVLRNLPFYPFSWLAP
jgi:hypothetical protein